MLARKTNRKIIIAYYAIALLFVILGIYRDRPVYYIAAVLLLGLALLRKYWLDKKLRE